MFGGSYAPMGWAFCNGQLVPISQNTALFSIIGTYYGGDGMRTFALPNLGGSLPIGVGQGRGLSQRDLGESGGEATVTLINSEMPVHTHPAAAVAAPGTTNSPTGATWAEPHFGRVKERAYGAVADSQLHPQSLAVAGAGQPHNNLPPYLTVSFIIAMEGIFPQRQ